MRRVLSELENDHLSEYACSSNAPTQRTHRTFRGYHTIAAVRAGVLGQDVDLQFKVGGDEIQHACLILADACLGLSAVRAELIGLRDVVLDADLRQSLVIRLT
jgi:hypothetical protein